jgi:Uncharacterized protein involved in propionate catabolism
MGGEGGEAYKILQTSIKFWPVEYHAMSAVEAALKIRGYRARIRNHGHSCFLCEIVIRSQFHTTYEPEA